MAAETTRQTMPRDNLVRAVFPADLEIRDNPGSAEAPTLVGHFAVFDEWTEISSVFEGRFMERIAPGAFAKTFSEQTPKVLFNHGSDPQIGDKVLGPVENLTEDKQGARYEVPLFDTSYNRDLLPGLRAGVYGASFRFQVMREDIVDDPEPSDGNPRGLPERTITEAKVFEFGPVTFPAYPGASAGVRSLTDQYRRGELAERVDAEDLATLATMISAGAEYISDQDEPDDQKNVPVMEGVLQTLSDLVAVEAAEVEPDESEDEEASAAPSHSAEEPRRDTQPEAEAEPVESTPDAAPPHPTESRRGTQTEERRANDNVEEPDMSIEEMLARQGEIKRELENLADANRGNVLSADDQSRWDSLVTENEDLKRRYKAENDRREYLTRQAADPAATESVADNSFINLTRPARDKAPDDVFDVAAYHGRARDQDQMRRMLTDGAKRAVESIDFVDTRTDESRAKANVEHALNRDSSGELAQYVLSYGSPTYRRAFGKTLQQVPLTQEEQRSLGIGSQGGQMPVPIQIDPTVTLVSNGAINPLRQIARTVTMTGYEWRGVTTTGVTASYAAEGAVSADNSPTLIQPTIDAERASVFVPYSFEVGQDWNGLEEELGGAIADSKDVLEATAFLTGAGHASSLPRGVLRACATVTGTAANTVFAVGDVYNLETQLPPRFRANASFVLNKAVVQRIRQFDTSGGAALWNALPAPLQTGMPSRLIGYPVYELSTMSTAVPSATGGSWALFGDFSKFIIADRIGMSISVIPQLFNGNTAGGLAYPTGQSGLFAFWRNSSDVMSSNAFRGGTQT